MPKLLFVNQPPFYPDSSGGAQRSAMYLFESLQKKGWQIEVFCGLSLRSPYFQKAVWQSLKQFRKPPVIVKDEDLGYPCWRRLTKLSNEQQWLESLDQRLQDFAPDVVMGHSTPFCPLLNHAADQGYFSIYFARNLYNITPETVLSDRLHIVANAPYTAAGLAHTTAKEIEVVLPFVESDRYRVAQRERRYITFINPVPEKGVDIAIEVARQLPNEKFLFVKGKWSDRSQRYLESLLEPVYALPNVEVWDHLSDMRPVYAVTDILLVPSQAIETFGRVIVEAQINEIPVVGADIGGIPYALGQGGLLANPIDDPSMYVEALKRLKSDPDFYAQVSRRAIQNSQRPEFDPQYQVQKFIRFVEARLESRYTLAC
jgi:glycosyltransferase involved in cell wall biosynthesis